MEFKSDVPIYIQIASDIKEKIINGMIQEGDKLGSVREYSVEYEVSALTIQRTMQFLEMEQVIESKRGIGSFVRKGAKKSLEENVVDATVREFVLKMRNCGLSDSAIMSMVEKVIYEEGGKR